MFRLGLVLFLLGIPGLLLFVIPGVILMGLGGLLMVMAFLTNTAKAGAGVGKFAAKTVTHSVTTKKCPDCRTDMPKAATVCLACGYRETQTVAAAPAETTSVG